MSQYANAYVGSYGVLSTGGPFPSMNEARMLYGVGPIFNQDYLKQICALADSGLNFGFCEGKQPEPIVPPQKTVLPNMDKRTGKNSCDPGFNLVPNWSPPSRPDGPQSPTYMRGKPMCVKQETGEDGKKFNLKTAGIVAAALFLLLR